MTKPRATSGRRWVPLLVVLVLSACSPDDPATTSTVPPRPELALSDLSGSWENGSVALRVNDAGDYVVVPVDNPDQEPALLGGFVARDERNFIFVTGVGGRCPGETGVYDAVIDSGALTLTLVEDPCQQRAGWFEEPFSRSES